MDGNTMAEMIERLHYFISGVYNFVKGLYNFVHRLYNFVNEVYNKRLNLSLSYLSADDFEDLMLV